MISGTFWGSVDHGDSRGTIGPVPCDLETYLYPFTVLIKGVAGSLQIMNLRTEYVTFPTRGTRSQFVEARFRDYLKETVLDVGCFEAPLRELLTGVSYTGVDIDGNPDIRLDLEACERLPFERNSFYCVICVDVLEHLDNLHFIFQELVRVARRHLIISLPNCWCDARLKIDRGRGSFAHYGLPTKKPLDRHKWFFSLSEARGFLEVKAEENGLTIAEMFFTEKPRNSLVSLCRKIRYLGDRYKNRYTQTIWAVYEMNSQA